MLSLIDGTAVSTILGLQDSEEALIMVTPPVEDSSPKKGKQANFEERVLTLLESFVKKQDRLEGAINNLTAAINKLAERS